MIYDGMYARKKERSASGKGHNKGKEDKRERREGGGYLALASADVNVQGVCLVHLHGAVLMIFPI